MFVIYMQLVAMIAMDACYYLPLVARDLIRDCHILMSMTTNFTVSVARLFI